MAPRCCASSPTDWGDPRTIGTGLLGVRGVSPAVGSPARQRRVDGSVFSPGLTPRVYDSGADAPRSGG
jgi:hypothetical protein